MGIEFSETGSMLFFYVVFLMSAFNAGIGANQFRVNRFFGRVLILLSFVILFIPLGMRSVGIDHEVYVEWYEHADYWLSSNYRFTPEPLFALLTLVAKNVFGEFQIVYLFSGFVYLAGLFVFLRKAESFGYTSLFFMSISIYLYMCGLARISIAIGIVSFAFAKIDRKFLPIILIFVATLFHYSAIIAILVYFSYRSKKSVSFKNTLYIIIGVLILSFVIKRFSSSLPFVIRRYASYVELSFGIRNITSSIILVPAVVLWFLFKDGFKLLYGEKNIFYDNVIKIIFALICLSMAFNGLFRLAFFFYPFVAKIYIDFNKVLVRTNQRQIVPFYGGVFTMLGLVYVYAVFYTSPYITPLIIPFKM